MHTDAYRYGSTFKRSRFLWVRRVLKFALFLLCQPLVSILVVDPLQSTSLSIDICVQSICMFNSILCYQCNLCWNNSNWYDRLYWSTWRMSVLYFIGFDNCTMYVGDIEYLPGMFVFLYVYLFAHALLAVQVELIKSLILSENK